MNIVAIIHTLNAGEFLKPCLDSIGDIPVYIFDQGSTDDTVQIARDYNKSIALFRDCPKFTDGEAAARNRALDIVSRPGFFTHFLRIDADEILTDGWLEIVQEICYLADCISADYWQIVDRPIMSQVGNPIEKRGLIYKLACHPRYESRPGKNWHCGIVGPKDTLHVTDPALIHLGYATKNLTAKWLANIERGDYSDRDDVNNQLRESMTKNPRAHLHNRGPIPQELLDRSKYLTALAHE